MSANTNVSATKTPTATKKSDRVKPVETLVLANIAFKAEQKRLNGDNSVGCKEDERITTAVMKVLEGYDWNLVQASANIYCILYNIYYISYETIYRSPIKISMLQKAIHCNKFKTTLKYSMAQGFSNAYSKWNICVLKDISIQISELNSHENNRLT
uniref:Sox_N domain-containing protein n=1 Tax=Glossina brevipalpis TaxID=37001 RepID=A0A1A9WZ13_9MUSC